MLFQNCLQNVFQNFLIPSLVDNGIIKSVSAQPPQWLAIGGLTSSSFVSCLVCSYWCDSPLSPSLSYSYTDIVNQDQQNFSTVAMRLTSLSNALSNSLNNLSFINEGLNYDLLQLLYLNYSNYYAYLQSVENYYQYVVSMFEKVLQPYIQNFILSAQSLVATLKNIQSKGTITVANPFNNFTVTANIINVEPVVVYFPNTPIPAGFGVYIQLSGKNMNYSGIGSASLYLVFLFSNPNLQYTAITYSPNNTPVSQSTITINNVVIEQQPFGITTVLPYLVLELFSTLGGQPIQGNLSGVNVYLNTVNNSVYLDQSAVVEGLSSIVGNVAIVISNSQNLQADLVFTNPNNVVNFVSLYGLAQYYEVLTNVNLSNFANYLWDYEHQNGVTQQQLYQLLNGINYNMNIPTCNPSLSISLASTLSSILAILISRNQTAQINVYPVYTYGQFEIQGGGVISGYAQFNQPIALPPGACTNVGGFIVDQNGELHLVQPGQTLCNVSNYTVVFRPDVYVSGNSCNFVPIPYNVVSTSNQPQNSVGIVLDLNDEVMFTQGENYSQLGWFVNSQLDAYTPPSQINFTPNQSLLYIPSNLAYLVLSSQGIQNNNQNAQPMEASPVVYEQYSSSSSVPPQQPQQIQPPQQQTINPIWILVALLFAGLALDVVYNEYS